MINLLITQRAGTDRHGEPIDILEKSYTVYFNSIGINLLPVSNFIEDVDGFLKVLDYEGLIMSGGGDVNPSCCVGGESSDFKYSPERDRVERALIETLLARGKPIFGVCYGMQQLNCYFGGSITPAIHSGHRDSRRPGLDHNVSITGEIFGLKGEFRVNHYHDHGVSKADVAAPFNIFAEDLDFGVVEGIVHSELPIMGIQWHPERASPDEPFNEKIIKNFFKKGH